ncbi:MAG: ankyrin repeat domain-containing protein [Candidatus Eremiobacteraeota bacterium]|nr:ankyrin repeat domain-containing protein [Candidatus Eremiobacteraeota bacterium]
MTEPFEKGKERKERSLAGIDVRFLRLWDASGKIDIPKSRAFMESHPEFLTLKDTQGNTLLHWLACRDESAAAEGLLYMGALLESRDCNGCTPLYHAVLNGGLRTARVLINYGADINAADGSGLTPLHIAAANGSLDLVKLLVSKGASSSAVDRDGLTPLDIAESRGRREVSGYLKSLAGISG